MAKLGDSHRRAPREYVSDKRGVFSHSRTVVRAVASHLLHSRALWALICLAVVIRIGLVLVMRSENAGACADQACGRRGQRIPLVFAQQLMFVSVQLIAARHIVRSMSAIPRRVSMSVMAILVVISAGIAVIDLVSEQQSSVVRSLVLGGLAFVMSFVFSYVVPATVVDHPESLSAARTTRHALSETWHADLLAWSGVWVVTGSAALLSALPGIIGELFDAGGKSIAMLTAKIGLGVPVQLISLAVGAGFVSVILWSVNHRQAPDTYPTDAVETICGMTFESPPSRPDNADSSMLPE